MSKQGFLVFAGVRKPADGEVLLHAYQEEESSEPTTTTTNKGGVLTLLSST